MTPTEEIVLEAAVSLAERKGLAGLRRNEIAKKAKLSAGTTSNAFGGKEGLVAAVVDWAVANSNYRILADAIVSGHPRVSDLSTDQKRAAFAGLVG